MSTLKFAAPNQKEQRSPHRWFARLACIWRARHPTLLIAERRHQLIATAALTIAALALTHLLWAFVQYSPFVLGFAAVIVSSRIGGRPAGVLAVLIGVAGYAMFPPSVPPERLPRVLLGFATISGAFGWVLARRYEIERDLRASQATASRSERRLQAIIDAEPACVALMSADGWLLDVNRAGLHMLGADTLPQAVGLPVASFVHPADQSRYAERLHEAVQGTPTRLEFRIVGLTGTERWVDSHAVGFDLMDESGSRRCVLSVISDMTERKQLEARLRGAQHMEVVGRLAGGVAHDFNNVLTAIGGFAQLVSATLPEGDDRLEDLAEVQKGCDRAAALTRQLLAFSRRQPLDPRVLDVNELIAGTERLLRRTMREDVDMVMRLDAADPVRLDPTQFEQVLLNLALNARDAMPAGGQLRVATESVDVDDALARQRSPMSPGRYVRIVVADTGVGMDPETQRHVFEPFFTTKPSGKGTGLGLASVYGTVKQSDGFIWLDSEEGRGTSVAIYLPTVDVALERAPVATDGPPVLIGGSETILLVEDDPAVRRLASHALAGFGYVVLEARDGGHALELSASHAGHIDLLVTDVVMPGLNGPALAARLCGEREGLRVLYISGYADGITAPAGVTRGRVPLLSKPFLSTHLVQRVRSVLDDRNPFSIE